MQVQQIVVDIHILMEGDINARVTTPTLLHTPVTLAVAQNIAADAAKIAIEGLEAKLIADERAAKSESKADKIQEKVLRILKERQYKPPERN